MSAMGDIVFISYAREDAQAAHRLYEELTTAGVNVWFDQESLTPGAKWKPAIRKAIRDSRYFIALISSRSASKKGFVQSELREAIDVLDEFPENETYLIPARLDACEAPHERLNDLHWVDLFPDWKRGKDKLLRFFGVDTKKAPHTEKETIKSNRTATFAPTVRVDGVYQSKKIGLGIIGEYYQYLRFYADGLTVSASASAEPYQIIWWLNKESAERPGASKGVYTISGPKLKCSLSSSDGTVEYEGEIQGDFLVMRTHSHINGHRGIYEYKFVQS
jgi:hypothetical protein